MIETQWFLLYTSILLGGVVQDSDVAGTMHRKLLGPDRDSQVHYEEPFLERVDLVAGLGGNLTDPTLRA